MILFIFLFLFTKLIMKESFNWTWYLFYKKYIAQPSSPNTPAYKQSQKTRYVFKDMYLNFINNIAKF